MNKNRLKQLPGADQELLQFIDERSAIVQKRVASVAQGYTHAFFVWGPGGHGKSHAIAQGLKQYAADFRYYNSDMSAPGLVEELCKYHESIHFLEDMEQLYKDAKAQGVLRSACASPNGKPRVVTWTNKKAIIRFPFKGGIIIAANQPLKTYGNLGAIASRFSPVEWRLSDPELGVMMRYIATGGFEHNGQKLTASECLEVADFLVAEMEVRTRETKVDLRTFTEQALPDFLQWKNEGGLSWESIVRSRIQGEPVAERRSERVDRQRHDAVLAYLQGNNTDERLLLFRETTGLGRRPFYDRIKEARQCGLFEQITTVNCETVNDRPNDI
ncbi:hypothetical protein [Gimesia sp.]|uniref:hypothetical protein n=1 Tax=Gimesia sp. TaxID=2024833 RepID=UPI003A918116